MSKTRLSRLKLVSLVGISLLAMGLITNLFVVVPQAEAKSMVALAATGKLQPAQLNLTNGTTRRLPFYTNGTLAAAKNVIAGKTFGYELDKGEAADEDTALDAGSTVGVAAGSVGCRERNAFDDDSVRVNQDCTFRRQAETLIKANPTNPQNLIAGQNDSRIGYNHCGFDYSIDGGRHWGDGLPPFWSRLNSNPAGHTIEGGPGTGHTYDAASDPALAFDSRGNAYFSCITFDVGSNASGMFVTLSPNPAGGSFYNNVPGTGPTYTVVEDNSPNVFHDKQFIVADSYPSSKYRDRVYVTWTLFRQDCPGGYCSSTIYSSYSSDNAKTWSKPIEISGNNPDLCFFGNALDPRRNVSDCDFNQGSDPIVLPNGDVVVTFNNGNTPAGNPNSQQLSVRSTDGGVTWSKPVKVGNDIIAPASAACDFGRGPEQCIQGPRVRTNDFPRIAVDHSNGKNRGNLFVVWQDYRFGEYDIILSVSTDGGKTWKESTKPVNPSKGSDHYFPAIDVAQRGGSGDGSLVAVSYYRSPKPTTPAQIGTLGQEYFISGGFGKNTPYDHERIARMSPAPDGIQAGFNGDYSGLVVTGNTAHPFWSDTRNKVPTPVGTQGVTHDEDVFTVRIKVPNSDGDNDD